MRASIWGATFGLVISVAVTGLLLTECSDDNPGTGGDGGTAGCPTNPPSPGTACVLANGTMCNQYPQPGCACCAGNNGYECLDGKWEEVGVAGGQGTPSSECPVTVPDAGTPCQAESPCGGATAPCFYDCTTGNGVASETTCPGGTWVVQELPTSAACPVDAGVDADLDASDGGG